MKLVETELLGKKVTKTTSQSVWLNDKKHSNQELHELLLEQNPRTEAHGIVKLKPTEVGQLLELKKEFELLTEIQKYVRYGKIAVCIKTYKRIDIEKTFEEFKNSNPFLLGEVVEYLKELFDEEEMYQVWEDACESGVRNLLDWLHDESAYKVGQKNIHHIDTEETYTEGRSGGWFVLCESFSDRLEQLNDLLKNVNLDKKEAYISFGRYHYDNFEQSTETFFETINDLVYELNIEKYVFIIKAINHIEEGVRTFNPNNELLEQLKYAVENYQNV